MKHMVTYLREGRVQGIWDVKNGFFKAPRTPTHAEYEAYVQRRSKGRKVILLGSIDSIGGVWTARSYSRERNALSTDEIQLF